MSHEQATERRQFLGRMFGVAMLLVRQPYDADEVVQDAFLSAWQYQNRHAVDITDVRSWLIVITRNAARKHLRRRYALPLGDDLASVLPSSPAAEVDAVTNVALVDTQTNQRIDRVSVGGDPANAAIFGSQ